MVGWATACLLRRVFGAAVITDKLMLFERNGHDKTWNIRVVMMNPRKVYGGKAWLSGTVVLHLQQWLRLWKKFYMSKRGYKIDSEICFFFHCGTRWINNMDLVPTSSCNSIPWWSLSNLKFLIPNRPMSFVPTNLQHFMIYFIAS